LDYIVINTSFEVSTQREIVLIKFCQSVFKLMLLSFVLFLLVHAEDSHIKTSSTNASYGVSTLIPEWTPDLREEETQLKAQRGDFISVPISVAEAF